MTSGDISSVVTAIAALTAAIGSVLGAVVGFRNSAVIREVQHATNSMKDELVAVTRSDAKQSGIIEGRQQALDEVR